MKLVSYKAKRHLEILDIFILSGDMLYATESFHVMNGEFDYARKVFDRNGVYLGMIRDSSFPKDLLEECNEPLTI